MIGRLEWLLGCLLGLGVQGCTVLGAGVGAGVDRAIPGPYEERAPDQVRLRRGDRVVLLTRKGRRLEGRYLGALPPGPSDVESYVYLEREEGLTRVALSDVRAVGVEVMGNGWVYGAVIGLVVDVAVVVGVAIALSNFNPQLDLSGNQSGCFC